MKLKNTLRSLKLFMENYRVRVIMFSSSPPIVEYSMSLGLDVVPSYL